MSAIDYLQVFQTQKRWRIINETVIQEPSLALGQDFNLLKEVALGKRGATARVWQSPQCLVATRKETRFPNFESASKQLAAEHWPVIVRDSGGTAVPLQPGVLNLALIFPQAATQQFDLDCVYLALCEPIKRALSHLGLHAEYGATEGSYCDGRYNLNVGGLKITGTAQKIMLSPPSVKGVKQAVLAQAMLMVDVDAQLGTDQVNKLYTLSGNDRRFDPAVATSLKQLLSHSKQIKTQETADLTNSIREILIKELHVITMSS